MVYRQGMALLLDDDRVYGLTRTPHARFFAYAKFVIPAAILGSADPKKHHPQKR
jgi:hypothetical protein